MIQQIPSLAFSARSLSSSVTPKTNRSRLIPRRILQQQVEIIQGDIKLVGFQYFRKKEMFCTIITQKDKIQLYTEKNSILLVLWINIVLKYFEFPVTSTWQSLHQQQFNVQMHAGIPSQFAGFNNNTTIKSFLIKAIQILTNLIQESPLNLQKYLIQMLIDYPFFAYCGIVFVRAKGYQYLKENKNKYKFELLGNQEQMFQNYSIELRNTPLDIIADSLNFSISLKCNSNFEVVGSDKIIIPIQKSGIYYCYLRYVQNSKLSNSTMLDSTVTSSSCQLESFQSYKTCNRCLSTQTGKFCDCRKNKNLIQKIKKKCDKCQTQYIFVCKCYLDE